jgi:alpha-mannosidase
MYSYLYKYEIDLPEGARSVTLPKNEKIKVLSITVADDKNGNCTPLQLLYDDFKNEKQVQLRTVPSN